MLRRSKIALPSTNKNFRRRVNPTQHKYKEVNRWQKQAMGYTNWDYLIPHRKKPMAHRFNPEGANITKGTTPFAYHWWFNQQQHLANLPPKGYKKPKPVSQVPATWTPAFRDAVLSLTDEELREQIMDRLTRIIHEETQRDGYELRRLDFEGRPLESLPQRRIIEHFVLEEETLRDRIIGQVVETDFRLTPTSDERKEMKSILNIIDYILSYITAARDPLPMYNKSIFTTNESKKHTITDAVKDILSKVPRQPVLGFQHALPTTNHIDPHALAWESLHQHDWQFGKAIYKPRSREVQQGNIHWLRQVAEQKDRDIFNQSVLSGKAEAEHRKKIESLSL